jgi:DNA-binding CsgD family transcriptional regulator
MSTQSQAGVLQGLIGAIGEKDFAAIAAQSVIDWLEFDLATIVVHRSDTRPGLMFDNFHLAGGNQGVKNYLASTHGINPIIHDFEAPGAYRARDFRIGVHGIDDHLRPFLIESPMEELGYRTLGWPERMEEVGLCFKACKGVVELGIYRERGIRKVSANKLTQLSNICLPIAAAFDRHSAFVNQAQSARTRFSLAGMSPREIEVAELLLTGCSSEAIALRLDISWHTVKDHRKKIFRKLNIGALAELFACYGR